jgi:hypothetical protein
MPGFACETVARCSLKPAPTSHFDVFVARRRTTWQAADLNVGISYKVKMREDASKSAKMNPDRRLRHSDNVGRLYTILV